MSVVNQYILILTKANTPKQTAFQNEFSSLVYNAGITNQRNFDSNLTHCVKVLRPYWSFTSKHCLEISILWY